MSIVALLFFEEARGDDTASATRSALGQTLQRLGGADDGDALIGFEIEQIPVTGDDQVSLGRYCTGEHVIVVGIMGHDTRHGARLHGVNERLVSLKEQSG